VSQSFYKIFGYPTGVGALVARRQALARLRRPWFAGGTITVASVQGDKFYLAEGESAFEDGTPNYLALPAVAFGLEYISSVGIDLVHKRVGCLTSDLIGRLTRLQHANGAGLARIYGPRSGTRRGGTITFNFYDRNGKAIDHRDVEQRANMSNMSLRTGCFCNPGGGEIALGITGTELSSCFHRPEHETHLTVDDFRLCIDGKSTGAVRVSLGLVSNRADVDAFIAFAESFLT
jgi:selenocysteine lyase/cysteine desulfurase